MVIVGEAGGQLGKGNVRNLNVAMVVEEFGVLSKYGGVGVWILATKVRGDKGRECVLVEKDDVEKFFDRFYVLDGSV